LHLRARDWLAHGHHTDKRYNRVVLHVALDASSSSSPLASGGDAPVVCLNFSNFSNSSQTASQAPPDWPCANLPARVGPVALRTLLLWAGTERFERHVRAFGDDLSRAAPAHDTNGAYWTAPDRILWLALAEALGYGQHREALRQAGRGLLLGDPLDLDSARRSERIRLGGLLALWDRWRVTGPWEPLRAALLAGTAAVIMALRVPGGAISASRARIMAANVVFPFAAALAVRKDDASLAERACMVYLESPGLPSNQITREMTRQLGLVRHPDGAASQQGLQHLWANWCHAKDCERCPCNPRRASLKAL
jgi:uncharacterized protein DUF2851